MAVRSASPPFPLLRPRIHKLVRQVSVALPQLCFAPVRPLCLKIFPRQLPGCARGGNREERQVSEHLSLFHIQSEFYYPGELLEKQPQFQGPFAAPRTYHQSSIDQEWYPPLHLGTRHQSYWRRSIESGSGRIACPSFRS